MFLSIPYIEWLGYLASVIIAVSLLMSSIVKLRWLNLAGAVLISTYGFLLGSIPVGGLNLAIAIIDIYYLHAIYTKKEYFKVLEILPGSSYLKYFLGFYKNDIAKFFPDFDCTICDNKDMVNFYILRDMATAGVFIGQKCTDGTLLVHLDYTVPEYRDCKIGTYIYDKNERHFAYLGCKQFASETGVAEHESYLLRMGFVRESERNGKKRFVKPIRPNSEFID